jgi:pimeloyl-ACP methyl ester carboxylesterase
MAGVGLRQFTGPLTNVRIDMKQPVEIQLDTPLGELAGLRWKTEGGPPVLCLHGWLDNAASFLPLAEHLSGLDIVALDLPGHGLSEHRHHTARYHFIDYLWDVDAVLNALGWESCHIIGHSMGGGVSSIYAAASPTHIRSIVVLEGLGPLSSAGADTTMRLRKSMTVMRKERNPLRPYDSIDEMVAARRLVSDLSVDAARLLCERSARLIGSHYYWRTDPALNWISPIVLTEDQVLDCLSNIEAPLLSWIVTPFGEWYSPENLLARQEATQHGQHKTIEGHHHFHMDVPEKFSETIQSFIFENDQTPSQRERHEQPDKIHYSGA